MTEDWWDGPWWTGLNLGLFFLIKASADFDKRTVSQAVHIYKELSAEHVFFKDSHVLFVTLCSNLGEHHGLKQSIIYTAYDLLLQLSPNLQYEMLSHYYNNANDADSQYYFS